jgi:hypothetical protein
LYIHNGRDHSVLVEEGFFGEEEKLTTELLSVLCEKKEQNLTNIFSIFLQISLLYQLMRILGFLCGTSCQGVPYPSFSTAAHE